MAAGVMRLEVACGEPDDVGVYRDLDDGVAGAVVLSAVVGEHVGQGLFPGAGGELAHALPLAWDPDAGAQGLVDGAGGVADGGLDVLPLVVAQLGEVAALGALHDAYRQRETVFAGTMADRAAWDTATRAQRHLAAAADAELRRRHPGQDFFPLRSAELEPATDSQRAELTLTAGQPPGEMGQWITDLAAAHIRRTARRPAEPDDSRRGSPLR